MKIIKKFKGIDELEYSYEKILAKKIGSNIIPIKSKVEIKKNNENSKKCNFYYEKERKFFYKI